MNQVYLLLGPEKGEKSLFVKRFLEELRQKTAEQPEIQKYYPYDTPIIDIIAELQNGSLFATSKVVFINNIEDIKKQQDLTLLAEYCRHPAAGSVLFLMSDLVSGISARLEKAVSKENKKIFWEMFENRKLSWIYQFFKQERITLGPQVGEYLLEMIENNTWDLRTELAKLVLFFKPGAHLEVEEIEKYIFHSKEENVFTLFEKIAVKDFEGAIDVLSKILLSKDADAVSLLAGLLWQIRRLVYVRQLINQNYTAEEALKKNGIINKKSQRIYLEAAKKYSLLDAQNLLILLAEFEERVRSSRSEWHPLLLEMFLYYSIERRGCVPQQSES